MVIIENQIHKNTANTSSPTLRGCVMIFEPETCLYVSSVPKNKKLKKKFQNGGFFQYFTFFWQNSVFANFSWFCDRIWKNIFSSQSSSDNARLQINVKNFYCSSSGSGDIREKHKFQKLLDVFFCYFLYM